MKIELLRRRNLQEKWVVFGYFNKEGKLHVVLNVWSVCYINSQLFENTTCIEWLCVQQTLSRPSVESQQSEIHAPATWTFLWLYVSMTIFELWSFDAS